MVREVTAHEVKHDRGATFTGHTTQWRAGSRRYRRRSNRQFALRGNGRRTRRRGGRGTRQRKVRDVCRELSVFVSVSVLLVRYSPSECRERRQSVLRVRPVATEVPSAPGGSVSAAAGVVARVTGAHTALSQALLVHLLPMFVAPTGW